MTILKSATPTLTHKLALKFVLKFVLKFARQFVFKFAPKFVLTLTAVLLINACALRTQHDLVTFHEGKLPRGETISIQPAERMTPDNLEFSYYRVLMAEQLRQLGYTPVASDEPATLVAEVDYSVTDGQIPIGGGQRDYFIYPFSSSYYVRYHFHNGRHHNPYYYGISDQWPLENYSYAVYNRKLAINITDKTTAEILFEGRAQSIGREKEIASAMPYMITAMFNNFPGENGITKVVTIEQ